MKKLLTFVISVLLMISFVNAEEKEKVKVYMFEAGGCPYCEEEEKYLKSLDGYNKTFKLVKKELYVDHIEWKQGKDYELGKAVAEAFNEAGFEDASYEGTPFVVISDTYAAASYNTNLESIINAAYEEGDKDAVSCIKDKGTNCIRTNNNTSKDTTKEPSSNAGIVVAILGGIAFVGVLVYVFTRKHDDLVDTEDEESFEEDDIEEEILEEVNKQEVKEVKKQNTYHNKNNRNNRNNKKPNKNNRK